MLLGVAVLAAVLATTAFVYRDVLTFPFVEWDDPGYVARNEMVKKGLGWPALRWAFTTTEFANWHPITWLSFLIEVELFGLDPRASHAINLALHLASTALLCCLLGRGTERWTPAACVAALFALHPLRVESVAWVAERKGLLAAAFGMLAIGQYGAFAARGSLLRLAAALALFAGSLLAKPVLVTLPLLLLALDVWPLRRFAAGPEGVPARRLLLEKVPFLALAVASSAITFFAQQAGGAMSPGESIPLAARLVHALVMPGWYLAKFVVPAGLSPLYTHPDLPGGTPWALWQIIPAGALVIALSVLAVRTRERQPWLFAGWGWFLISLVPVLGLVQVGFQAGADRYTYLPLLGPLVAIVWSIADRIERIDRKRRSGTFAVAIALLAAAVAAGGLALQTRSQIEVWRSSAAVFERALAVSPNDPTAHLKLGNVRQAAGDNEGARVQFEAAVRVRPGWFKPRMNLGHLLLARGEIEAAIVHFEAAAADPASQGKGHRYLGFALAQLGRDAEAEPSLREAVRLDPADSRGWNALGVVLERLGRRSEALDAFDEAARLDPRWPAARANAERLRQP